MTEMINFVDRIQFLVNRNWMFYDVNMGGLKEVLEICVEYMRENYDFPYVVDSVHHESYFEKSLVEAGGSLLPDRKYIVILETCPDTNNNIQYFIANISKLD